MLPIVIDLEYLPKKIYVLCVRNPNEIAKNWVNRQQSFLNPRWMPTMPNYSWDRTKIRISIPQNLIIIDLGYSPPVICFQVKQRKYSWL